MKKFIFASIILAMISMINSILIPPHPTAKFFQCVFLFPVPVLPNITLSPDPLVAGKLNIFTISGKLDKDVIIGDSFVVEFVNREGLSPLFEPFTMDICSRTGIKCPIKAGTALNISEEVLVPADLPGPDVFAILVSIGDIYDKSSVGINEVDPNYHPIACGIAVYDN
ncbi:15104_t:CDS:1 [Funneliformis geosporum]|uniref:Phosphatidylglycerol/phosphatidylinositol transfer protein n=1 Tax=Funneliformis geosporum TaxID=1117311 RepID=A0A9W4WVN2_9GLOM|nr:15104_t:CDS:1 [Funneliformis geosporum]CAI2175545.1 5791_t:CDS:1 [Funneliformis geosporum]